MQGNADSRRTINTPRRRSSHVVWGILCLVDMKAAGGLVQGQTKRYHLHLHLHPHVYRHHSGCGHTICRVGTGQNCAAGDVGACADEVVIALTLGDGCFSAIAVDSGQSNGQILKQNLHRGGSVMQGCQWPGGEEIGRAP